MVAWTATGWPFLYSTSAVIQWLSMIALSPKQERRIIQALTEPSDDSGIGSGSQKSQHHYRAIPLLPGRAKGILKTIYVDRKVIEAMSESSGTHPGRRSHEFSVEMGRETEMTSAFQ